MECKNKGGALKKPQCRAFPGVQWLTLCLRCKGHGFNSWSFLVRELRSHKPWESEVAQSCRTLCNPMNCRLPGSSGHGIFQARVLEWVAISFSRGSYPPRDWNRVACIADSHFTIWAIRETNQKEAIICSPNPKFCLWKLTTNHHKVWDFLSTSHMFSLYGPAINLFLLQTLMFQFIWPHCASGTQSLLSNNSRWRRKIWDIHIWMIHSRLPVTWAA